MLRALNASQERDADRGSRRAEVPLSAPSTSPNPNDHGFATFREGGRGEGGGREEGEKREGGVEEGGNKRREFTGRASAFGDGGDGDGVSVE